MVFQNYALYPHLTVYENIAFPLRLAKKFSDAGDRPEGPRGVEDARARRAPRAQAGQPLRWPAAARGDGARDRPRGRGVPLRRAAVRTSTPSCAARCAPRSRGLQKRLGITTVYVTHDQTEAMTLGDRVAVLKRGILQQLATPARALREPVNLFVAGFIGSPPMNFLPATVEGDKVELPFGTVDVPRGKAAKVPGQGPADRRHPPEHFEDAASWRATSRAGGRRSGATVDVVEWLGNEAYAYIPFEAPPEVREQLAAAGEGPRQGVAAHPAGRLARRGQPDQGGRRGRDLGRRPQDPPLQSLRPRSWSP